MTVFIFKIAWVINNQCTKAYQLCFIFAQPYPRISHAEWTPQSPFLKLIYLGAVDHLWRKLGNTSFLTSFHFPKQWSPTFTPSLKHHPNRFLMTSLPVSVLHLPHLHTRHFLKPPSHIPCKVRRQSMSSSVWSSLPIMVGIHPLHITNWLCYINFPNLLSVFYWPVLLNLYT